jgi:hypothetical protein
MSMDAHSPLCDDLLSALRMQYDVGALKAVLALLGHSFSVILAVQPHAPYAVVSALQQYADAVFLTEYPADVLRAHHFYESRWNMHMEPASTRSIVVALAIEISKYSGPVQHTVHQWISQGQSSGVSEEAVHCYAFFSRLSTLSRQVRAIISST